MGPEPTSRPTTSPTTHAPSSAPVMPTIWLPTPEVTDAPIPSPSWHPVFTQITESETELAIQFYGWDNQQHDLYTSKKLFFYAFAETCVVRRECPQCAKSHQVIYYKRISNDCSKFDAFDMLTNNWKSVDENGISNLLNVDFLLTNSEAVALDTSIQSLKDCEGRCWTSCDYNDRYADDNGLQPGGFRKCGYRELVGDYWRMESESPIIGVSTDPSDYQFYCDSETSTNWVLTPLCKSVRWSVL